MARKRLHDDWTRIGQLGTGYRLVVGSNEVHVVMLDDGKDAKSYKLDEPYAQLILAAYQRGLKQQSLW